MFLTESTAPSTHIGLTPHACLDLTGFPVVRMTASRPVGHAFAWCAAMRSVLARAEPFVYVDIDAAADEREADRQVRRCWFAANAIPLLTWCRGYIAIEGDIARRAEARATAVASLALPGPRVMVVSNMAVASQLAAVLLKAEARADAPVDRQAGRTGARRLRRI